jgi:hypothetical protein
MDGQMSWEAFAMRPGRVTRWHLFPSRGSPIITFTYPLLSFRTQSNYPIDKLQRVEKSVRLVTYFDDDDKARQGGWNAWLFGSEQVCIAVTQVLGSNLGGTPAVPSFVVPFRPITSKFRDILIRPRPLPSKSFPIHPFDAISSELLKASWCRFRKMSKYLRTLLSTTIELTDHVLSQ